MGDHPLRPPTRRSLGGPLPRQLANGTRGHPLAMNIWTPPHAGQVLIRCQTRFHRLVPGQGAGSSRVTHPFATLLAIANFLVRLACLIHAASVHSEPGSNSPLLKSLTAPLGALSFGSFVFSKKFRSRGPPHGGRALLMIFALYCAAQFPRSFRRPGRTDFHGSRGMTSA